MSTNRNNGRASNYGLLNSVRHAECGSVFYRGPCPRAGVVSPGICISPSGEVSGCQIPRDTRRAQICCDPDCIAEVSNSADDDDCCCNNCRLRCRCWRRTDQNGDANGSDSIVCRCRSTDSDCDATTVVRVRETEVTEAEAAREAEVQGAEEILEDEQEHEEEDNREGRDYQRGYDYRRGAWVE